jgi:hypothetical protein
MPGDKTVPTIPTAWYLPRHQPHGKLVGELRHESVAECISAASVLRIRFQLCFSSMRPLSWLAGRIRVVHLPRMAGWKAPRSTPNACLCYASAGLFLSLDARHADAWYSPSPLSCVSFSSVGAICTPSGSTSLLRLVWSIAFDMSSEGVYQN